MDMQTKPFPAPHVIDAECVELALRSCRWERQRRQAAISNGGFSTNSRRGYGACRAYAPDIDTRRPVPPLLKPLNFDRFPVELVEHVRLCHGLAEVRRTWGIGYKALLAELTTRRAA